MKTVAEIKKEAALRKDADLEVMLKVAAAAHRERRRREEKAARERARRAREARRNSWSSVFPAAASSAKGVR